MLSRLVTSPMPFVQRKITIVCEGEGNFLNFLARSRAPERCPNVCQRMLSGGKTLTVLAKTLTVFGKVLTVFRATTAQPNAFEDPLHPIPIFKGGESRGRTYYYRCYICFSCSSARHSWSGQDVRLMPQRMPLSLRMTSSMRCPLTSWQIP